MSAVIIRLRVFIAHERFGGERFVAAFPRDRVGELIARLLTEAGIEEDPRKWELCDGDRVVFPDLTVGEILGYNRAWSNLTLQRTGLEGVNSQVQSLLASANDSDIHKSDLLGSVLDIPMKNDSVESGALAIGPPERSGAPKAEQTPKPAPDPDPPAPPPVEPPPQAPETPPLFNVTPTVASSDELLALIRKSGVVEEARLDNWLQSKRSGGLFPSQPKTLAEAMIRDGLLTNFHAEKLLQGKYKRFTIGKYKVLERLSSDAEVFLCEHKLMHRRVAIKVLPTNIADEPSSLERFYREARAVAAVDHPNIVRPYDIDQDENLHFLVMEYVDGSSLQDIVTKFGPLSVLRACHYIYAAAVGLQHAHEMTLIHRDIRPSKLMLDRNGIVKILDMGLARFFIDKQDDSTATNYGNASGTADYLASTPSLDHPDIRSDIYSLGATFYFLLTGQPLFPEGTAAQKLIWHQNRHPKPISSFRTDVPAQIVTIINKMIAKKTTDRYQTPVEVMAALAPWVVTPIPPPDEREMPSLSAAAGMGVKPAASPAPAGGMPGLASVAPGGTPRSPAAPASEGVVWQSIDTPSTPPADTAIRTDEAPAPQQAPPAPAPVLPKPAPMAPPATRAAPVTVPSAGMAPDRAMKRSGRVMSPARAAAPAKTKTLSTTERRATVRYYSRMNPDRVFPLLVMLTRQEVEEIVKKYVEQKATGPLTIAKDVPLEIEPVLPGCQVHPPKVTTILGNSDDVFTFHIVPHVLGEVTGARVFIRQDHKTLAEIKLDMNVVQRTMVIASGLSTFVVPAASAVMKHFNVDLTPKDGSSPYLALLNFLYGQTSPLVLTLVLALVTLALWWFTRPKGRDVFWDITTKPPAASGK
ncbi:MAG: protein kinase [Gemmataceae bacterium]